MTRAVCALLGALGLVACREGGHDRLRIVLGSSPVSLDPHLTNESASFIVNSNLYDTLVQTDAALGARPGLATRWLNPDDLTWRFELREGVRFHDGEPLTSADVAFSIERARKDPASGWRAGLAAIERVETPSPLELIVRTREPYPTLLRALAALMVVPQHVFRPGAAPLSEHPIGSGPLRFVSRDRAADRVELRRFEDYVGARPPVESVSFASISDDGRRVMAVRMGEADIITDVPPAEAASLRLEPGIRLRQVTGLRQMFLAFDMSRARTPYASPPRNPFLDRRVRQAFAQAVNKEAIVRGVLRGFGQIATQFAAPGVFGFTPEVRGPQHAPDAARHLLAEAGFPRGFMVTLDAARGAYSGDAAAAERVAEDLRALGVEVRLNLLDKQPFFSKLDQRDTSLYMLSWNSLTGDMQEVYLFLLKTPDPDRGGGSDNAGGFSDPRVDAAFEEAGRIMTPTFRLEKLKAAVALAMDDIPWVPLYVQDQLFAIREPFDWTPRPDKRIRADEVRKLD